jgi:hypothetical protein
MSSQKLSSFGSYEDLRADNVKEEELHELFGKTFKLEKEDSKIWYYF